MHRFDVVIFGGGCGGLWLLYEFTRQGYRGLLLEERSRLATFASTRGQNRLHSGAMYAISSPREPPALFSACRNGYDNLLEFCRTAGVAGCSGSRGVYLYRTKHERDRIIAQTQAHSAQYGITLQPFDSGSFQAMGLREVARVAPHYKYGIETDEYSFRPTIILCRLVELIEQSGGEIRSVGPDAVKSLRHENSKWAINIAGEEVSAPVVVLASGVAAVEQFSAVTGSRPPVKMDASPVLVVHRRISDRFVSFQENDLSVHMAMAPYGNAFTLTLGRSREITTAADTITDFGRIYEESIWPAVNDALPNLVREGGKLWRFYACQKLTNTEETSRPLSRFGARHYFWIDSREAPGFYLYCPGKWTLARLAAQDFTRSLIGNGCSTTPPQGTEKSRRVHKRMRVSRPPAFEQPTHYVTAAGVLRERWMTKVCRLLGRSFLHWK